MEDGLGLGLNGSVVRTACVVIWLRMGNWSCVNGYPGALE